MFSKPAGQAFRAANVELLGALALEDVNVCHWYVLMNQIEIGPMPSPPTETHSMFEPELLEGW